VTLTLHKWVVGTNSPSTDCEAVSSGSNVNCWGKGVDITAIADGEASVNTANVVDYNLPNTPPPAGGTTLPTGSKSGATQSTFGEAGVNLTALNIFPANQCFHLGDAWLKSRSSGSSFTSDMKDFIAPIPINISNCGRVIIHKQTDPRGQNQNFTFTSNITDNPTPPNTDSTCAEAQGGYTGSYQLNDNGNSGGLNSNSAANTDDCPSVLAGNYTVSEGGPPGGYTFESLSCTNTPASGSGGNTTNLSGQSVGITVVPNGTTECWFINQLNTATLTTQVSNAGPVFPSAPVHDTATVTGNQAADTPSGTVTFFLCAVASGACTSGGTNIGTGTLSGSGATASATSPDVNTVASPLTPGRYCFRAEWPGDSNYPTGLTEFGGATGANECFTVRTIPTTTTTTPSVGSGGTTTFGSSVTDHAIVQATQSGDGTPTGSVTFFICNPSQTSGGACPAPNGTQVGSPVSPLTAIGGSSPPASSADSIGVTVNQTGTWCFRAVYTPGGANGSNYTGSSDASSGECFTVNDTTAATSAQTWLPNDSATVTAAHGAPLNGTLSIQLYSGTGCVAGSELAVSASKPLNNATSLADRSVSTANTTFTLTTSQSVSWLVTFTSNDTNVSPTSSCQETSTLTITN
jgi:hypothetical protein